MQYDFDYRVHKRRKTEENEGNDSQISNDILNEAIQEISSCVEEEVIEATPKPDTSKKNVSRKIVTMKLPSIDRVDEIKIEKIEDSKDAVTFVKPKDESDKKLTSPLRSVENHTNAGKENRPRNAVKWISSSLISPKRVTRDGFISTKSPKTRLSLSKPLKQCKLEFSKKSSKDVEDVSKIDITEHFISRDDGRVASTVLDICGMFADFYIDECYANFVQTPGLTMGVDR